MYGVWDSRNHCTAAMSKPAEGLGAVAGDHVPDAGGEALDITLVHADCMDLLRTLESESIDMVLTDPPYYGVVAAAWDHQWKTEDEYLGWCREWATECARVLKPGGCMYVWGTTKTDTFLRFKLDVLNKLDEMVYQNWIVWSYDWGGRTRHTFPRKHEDLLMYSKGKEFLFDADAVRVPYKMAKNVRAGVKNHALGKVPTDVWEKNNHTGSREYCGWHPTQKPLVLLERIIRANTRPGQTVLDIFSGSGSTAIAARRTGRKFVGCDAEPTYVTMSHTRIAELSP